jgi:leucyl-tRNA synthetase
MSDIKREEIEVAKDLSKDEIIVKAKESCVSWIEDKEIIKEIYVPNKLVNLVVK